MSTAPLSSTVRLTFYHPVSGILSAAWTTVLLKDGVAQVQTLTVTEAATNVYTVTFQTDATEGASWYLSVFAQGGGAEENWTVSSAAERALKALVNKLQIDGSGHYEIFDDDGETVLFSGTSTRTERIPD